MYLFDYTHYLTKHFSQFRIIDRHGHGNNFKFSVFLEPPYLPEIRQKYGEQLQEIEEAILDIEGDQWPPPYFYCCEHDGEMWNHVEKCPFRLSREYDGIRPM